MKRSILFTMPFWVCVLLLSLNFIAVEGRGGQKGRPVKLNPEQAAEARRTIMAWLECEECQDGELKAVVNLGKAAVPSLAAVLRHGPSPAKRELLHRYLVTNYKKLKGYEKKHPDTRMKMSEGEYVRTYSRNYVAQYRVRAVSALAEIGGSDSKKALNEAVKRRVRHDVRVVLKEAIKKVR